MNSVIVGMGEVGRALKEVLSKHYDVSTVDKGGHAPPCGMLHIAFPYSDSFIDECLRYISESRPSYVVIHSSVPVGTTQAVSRKSRATVLHSPVRGKHPIMKTGLLTYTKYISYDGIYPSSVFSYFRSTDMSCEIVMDTRKTELMKLLELARYGTYIAFAKEQESICKHFGFKYTDIVTPYEESRTEGLMKLDMAWLSQPILYPFEDYVGGHCTVEDMEILLNQVDAPLLRRAYDIDRGTKVWGSCNIYPTAKIGKGVSIGYGTEIGENVSIGDGVRIGAMCFLPEGVTVEDEVFIAPRVCVSNDKHPPSRRKDWGKVTIRRGAAVGMGAIILPGVTIGEGALIGAGAIVTKDVPKGEVWYGEASTPRGKRNGPHIDLIPTHR